MAEQAGAQDVHALGCARRVVWAAWLDVLVFSVVARAVRRAGRDQGPHASVIWGQLCGQCRGGGPGGPLGPCGPQATPVMSCGFSSSTGGSLCGPPCVLRSCRACIPFMGADTSLDACFASCYAQPADEAGGALSANRITCHRSSRCTSQVDLDGAGAVSPPCARSGPLQLRQSSRCHRISASHLRAGLRFLR